MAIGIAAANDADYTRWRSLTDVVEGLRRITDGLEQQNAHRDRNKHLPWPWRDPLAHDHWDPDRVAPGSLWAEAWEALEPRHPRLAITVADDTDLVGVVSTLRDTPGHDGGFVSITTSARGSWRFPLRIGFLPDDRGRTACSELLAGFASSSWQSSLIDPYVLGPARVSCDVLVVVSDPWEVPTRLLELREVRAGAVLIAHDLGSLPGLEVGVVDKVVDIASAWAVGFAAATDLRSWIIDLVRQLSHAEPLDRAFDSASARPSVLAADQERLVRETVDQRALRLAHLVTATTYAEEAEEEPESSHRDGTDIASDLERTVAESSFLSEAGAASAVTHLEAEAGFLLDRAGADRTIQARITDADAPEQPLTAFRAETVHSIEVRIAPVTGAGWLGAATAFPESGLEPDRPHRLTVVLTEPTLLAGPQTGTIELPVVGASTSAHFTLTTRANTTSTDARIIVLSGNRVLQTARLPETVGAGGADDTARAELAIAPTTTDVEDRRTFAAAFVVNKNTDGVGRLTSVVEEQAGLIRLDSETVVNAVRKIADRLTSIVDFPEDFAELGSPGSVELLTALAFHGAKLHRALVADSPGLAEVLARSRSGLQVVAAKPDAYFPFEFAYEFDSPRPGAQLCEGALEALGDPDTTRVCTRAHGAGVVCPLGFWGLRHVIERHAFQPAASVPADFLIRSVPRRGASVIRLGSAVLGASRRVDDVVPGGTASVRDALATAGAHVDVVTWEAWREAVRTTPVPSLLVLLAHTVHDDAVDDFGLEIGANSIELVFDRQSLPTGPAVVMLLGCETALAGKVSYERFPSLFRVAGAPVVVATLTEVLGRHAAPVASRLVAELHRQCAAEPCGLGDMMLAGRRHLLAEGLLPVLAVVAFGDADWLVGA
jgi:hypothetical protein